VQAVILVGGLGTRLRPLTNTAPKSMVTVDDRPFLVHLLELLGNNGITDVVLCIGYLGDQIREYLRDGRKFGVKIRYSEEKGDLLGTGGALKRAEDYLNERFFVINGDTYLPIRYDEVDRAFLKANKKGLMVLYDNREDIGVSNNVDINSNLIITKYKKGCDSRDLKYVDAGVLIFQRDVLTPIETDYPVSLEKSIFPILIEQGELAAYVTEQRFYDMGTPRGLKEFEEFLIRGN